MIAFKCKMCGGELNITDGNNICECEFCGTQQTIPTADNEKKVNLFNRANRLRMNAEFDKAATVYASITAEFPEEAEAYWGLCLSKYGIEYVDDPLTGNKIPTCHRTLTTSIMDDSDFDQACENADPESKRLYREEAKTIDKLQQDILSIVASEEPFDVFICYKETDNEGNRTEDSVLAQDIYDSLTSKGLKVFFARITLEDKLGKQYEPYIYAALHSAKVMLAVGTQYDYFDAVWVKNEWARYLDMMKTDKSKTLIPCFKGIDAYDMPKEFKNLQGQNMEKLGWLQDLSYGIIKLCGKKDSEDKAKVLDPTSLERNNKIIGLLDLARISIEKKNWDEANRFADEALGLAPQNGDAYLIKLMAEYHWTAINSYMCGFRPDTRGFIRNPLYKRVIQYGDEQLKSELRQYAEEFERKITENYSKKQFSKGFTLMTEGASIAEYNEAIACFNQSKDKIGTSILIKKCEERIIELRRQNNKSSNIKLDPERAELKKYMKQKTAETIAMLNEDQYLKKADEETEKINKEKEELKNNQLGYERANQELIALKKEMNNSKGLLAFKRRKELEQLIAQKEDEIQKWINVIRCEEEYIKSSEKVRETCMKLIYNAYYHCAGLYYDEGFFEEANPLYERCKGYQDADFLIHNDPHLIAAKREIEERTIIGSTMKFGHFKQTMKRQGQGEPIEWIVLAKESDKVLLLSKDSIELMEYDKEFADTWKDSHIRHWLNEVFLEQAFSSIEKQRIILSTLDNARVGTICETKYDENGDCYVNNYMKDNDNQFYFECYGDESTEDRIFLLSPAETRKYLSDKRSRKCFASDYVREKDNEMNPVNPYCEEDGSCSWVGRSPAENGLVFTVVGDGIFDCTDQDTEWGIRPAMWVKWEA